MMSLSAAGVIGRQEPRVSFTPSTAVDFSAGLDALDLADVAGRDSLIWQQNVVRDGMAKRADGQWAGYEVGVLVSRQNGKNGAIEVVELGWMMTEPGVSILHTAHEFQTALESMNKLEQLIRSHPLLEAEIESVLTSNGKESIRMKNGSIIRFRTRTKSGGRGFSVDRLVIDEAMIWSPASQAAIMPLLTTAENPQIWYLGSAADADEHEYCGKWSSLRERALAGGDDRLIWMEWSAPEPPTDPALRREWREDRDNWAMANPSLGHLITEDYIVGEMNAFRQDIDKWEVERLSAGRWPVDETVEVKPVIDLGVWGKLIGRAPAPTGVACLAIDVSAESDRSERTCSVVAAVETRAGRPHGQIGYHGPVRVAEVVAGVKAAVDAGDPVAVVIDPKSGAQVFIEPLRAAGIEPELVSFSGVQEATSGFLSMVDEGLLSHDGDQRMVDAIESAKLREFEAGGVAWARKKAAGKVCQLVAFTNAMWGLAKFKPGAVVPPPSVGHRPGAGMPAQMQTNVMEVAW